MRRVTHRAWSPVPTAGPTPKAGSAELNYLPWLNTQLSLQYTQYTKFNGGEQQLRRLWPQRLGDNDSTYLLVWFNF